jgi:hypothetical protein
MATFSKLKLGGSADGKSVKVTAATLGAATTIHTAPSSNTSVTDEIWLYAVNSSASTAKLTLLWGGISDPDDTIEISVAGESGLVLLIPGLMLQSNTSPNTPSVKAFANVASVINIHGYVNRIEP